jgi:hypothetical protein
MKLTPGNRVYWIDPDTNRRHKCEVTRVYKNKAKIATDDLRSLSVAIDELDLVPLPWKTAKDVEAIPVAEVEPVADGETDRSYELLSISFPRGTKSPEETYHRLPEWMKGVEAHLVRGASGSTGIVFGRTVPPDVMYPELYGDRAVVSSIWQTPPDTPIEPSPEGNGSIGLSGGANPIEQDSDRPCGSIGFAELQRHIERLSIAELLKLKTEIPKTIALKRRLQSCPPKGTLNRYERKGSTYWRYSYSRGGRMKHKHIAGGCVGSRPADDRAARVREMIAAGKPVEAIVRWLDSAKTEETNLETRKS